MTKPSALSTELGRLAGVCRSGSVSVEQLLRASSERSSALVPLVFSLPFLLPIPLPGLSILFGGIVAAVGLGIAIARDPLVPRWLRRKNLPSEKLAALFTAGERAARRIERWIQPQGAWFAGSSALRRLNGALIASCGLLLALPLPPGTNFPPAGTIILLSIGSLEQNSVFVIAGYVAFALNLALFGTLFVLARGLI